MVVIRFGGSASSKKSFVTFICFLLVVNLVIMTYLIILLPEPLTEEHKMQVQMLQNEMQSYKSRLKRTEGQLKTSQLESENLQKTVKSLNAITLKLIRPINKIQNDVTELWYYIKSKVNRLKGPKNYPMLHPSQNNYTRYLIEIKAISEEIKERKNVIWNNLDELHVISGAQTMKRDIISKLSKTVQKSLYDLQNPANCSEARKILCSINKHCGFGCQLHNFLHCFIAGYTSGRTVIIEDQEMKYSMKWTDVFYPISNTCTIYEGQPVKLTATNYKSKDYPLLKMLKIDTYESSVKLFPFLPQAVPKFIADELEEIHGHPFVWWMGQLFRFVFMLSPKAKAKIEERKQKINYTRPIVGVHVRRSDKVGSEAAFHSIEEYMEYVEEYYQRIEQVTTVEKRKVYLSTDDSKLYKEAIEKYPEYEILYNSKEAAQLAGRLRTRYTEESFEGLLADIYFMAHADHFIGTFSSQTGRVAYEWMQYLHNDDVSSNFNSLDDVYYVGGGNPHYNIAIHRHNKQNELKFGVGDYIGVAGNHWDGYSLGINANDNNPKSRNLRKLFPSYKVRNAVKTFDFVHFKEEHSRLEHMAESRLIGLLNNRTKMIN